MEPITAPVLSSARAMVVVDDVSAAARTAAAAIARFMML
jgi:adenine/guanine phosphoribosyltransferase-like PRPP-binding protein